MRDARSVLRQRAGEELLAEFGSLAQIRDAKNLLASGARGEVFQRASRLDGGLYALRVWSTLEKTQIERRMREYTLLDGLPLHTSFLQARDYFVLHEDTLSGEALFHVVVVMRRADADLHSLIRERAQNAEAAR